MWFWNWVGDLKPAQAAIVAALLGFLTLAFGHIFNSHLNRKRDKFLLEMDRLNLLRALTIEIGQIIMLARHQNADLAKKNSTAIGTSSAINPISFAVIYQNNLSSLYKLPPACLRQIVLFYIGLQEHEYNLITHGVTRVGDDGSLKSFTFLNIHLQTVRDLNDRLDQQGNMALEASYPIVLELERKLEGRVTKIKPTN